MKRPRSKKPPGEAKSRFEVPAILLEGDEPSAAAPAGPGEKFALAPASVSGHTPKQPEPQSALPRGYGKGRLTAVARDPYFLFASWDFTDEQQHHYNSLSNSGHLTLRAHLDGVGGPITTEVQVHRDSRHWYVPAARPGATYVLELGFYQGDGKWVGVRESGSILTPPDRVSEAETVRFASAQEGAPSRKMEEVLGHTERFAPDRATPAARHGTIRSSLRPWTKGQERALEEMVRTTFSPQLISSEGIVELLQGWGPHEAGLDISSPHGGYETVSSPLGGEAPSRQGFWFNINAELIVYGATEPGASVTIGGRPIRLRPDGTFSYRFALPDGEYVLPVAATPGDQSDVRYVELRFTRQSEFRGDVSAHPQEATLQPPTVDGLV